MFMLLIQHFVQSCVLVLTIDEFAVEIRHFESGLTHKQLIFENRYLDNFLSYDHEPSQVLSAR